MPGARSSLRRLDEAPHPWNRPQLQAVGEAAQLLGLLNCAVVGGAAHTGALVVGESWGRSLPPSALPEEELAPACPGLCALGTPTPYLLGGLGPGSIRAIILHPSLGVSWHIPASAVRIKGKLCRAGVTAPSLCPFPRAEPPADATASVLNEFWVPGPIPAIEFQHFHLP